MADLNRQERLVLSRYGTGEEIAHIATNSDLSHDTVNGIIARLAGYDRATARKVVRDYERRTAPAAAPEPPAAEPAPLPQKPPAARTTRRTRPSAPAEDPAERVRVATAVLDVTSRHAEEARVDLTELNGASIPAPESVLEPDPEIHGRRYGLTELLRRGDTSDDERCRKLAGDVRDAIDALHARLVGVAAEVKARADAEAKVTAARAALDAALAELAALNGHADVTTTPPSTEESPE